MLNSNKSPQCWTETGLLDELEKIDAGHHGHKICFILGAGASLTSGVPTGGNLVDEWLRTEHKRETDEKETFDTWLVRWASEGEKPIKDFDPKFPARYYPQIFERIYAGRYAQAYEFLDAKMKDAQPGIGYVSLAQILEFTRHKPVITTNFDNLVAEALYFYSGTRPLICGHESLAAFASANTIRPLVAKIHRDLFLNPINDAGTTTLAENWEKALTEIFRAHTPIVLGYGGNDGSLMGFLDSLEPGTIHNTIYWCHLAGEQLREDVLKIVAKNHGKLVCIEGFDQFMLKLHARLSKKWKRLQKRKIETFIQKRADDQIVRYKADLDKFGSRAAISDSKRDAKQDETFAALKKVTPSTAKLETWWTYSMRARSQKDISKGDLIYREGVKKFSTNPQLLGDYAAFLHANNMDNDRVQEFYDRAIKADPNNKDNLGNYALFLNYIRKDYDRAQEFYERTIKADPNNALQLGRYATFLDSIRKDYDRAQEFYERAIKADPNNAAHLCNYALFLDNIRKDYDRAQEFYERAVKADPNHANNLGNYAVFLNNIRKDYDRAQEFYERAIKADPNNAAHLCNYAIFLDNIRKDYDRAQEFYERAIKADPNNATYLGNHAVFLKNARKDYDRAQEFYERAIKADPNHANNLGNYAVFLNNIRKDYDRAHEFYERAIKADSSHAVNLGNYAGMLLGRGENEKGLQILDRAMGFLKSDIGLDLAVELWFYAFLNRPKAQQNEALTKLKDLVLAKAARSPTWDFSENISRAIQADHTDSEWLSKLSGVISAKAEPTILADWPAWQAA